MQGLPNRLNKHEGAMAQRLAALYGLKCSAQGSGKKLTLMVRAFVIVQTSCIKYAGFCTMMLSTFVCLNAER